MTNYIVLSFYETLLHQSDIDILTGPHWLNDTIISFYFEYMEKVKFKNAKELLFVSPEVTQCIKMVEPHEINTFLEPLKISERRFTFFALNDNNSPDVAGGTHWSLLVYSKPERTLFHYDSSNGSNHTVAWDFASHLVTYFESLGDSISFSAKDCTQQSNSYDCGIYVISNAENLARYTLEHGAIGTCDMSYKIYPSEKRNEILAIIRSLSSVNRATSNH